MGIGKLTIKGIHTHEFIPLRTLRYRVVALPGEGIGIEVVKAALDILRQLASIYGFEVVIDMGLLGAPALDRYGTAFPDATAQLCQSADGIILGAVSQGGLLELRQAFDFYVNMRPVQTVAPLYDKSPLKPEKLVGVDILFIRELVSGLYFGASGRGTDDQGAYGYHTMYYGDDQIRRIARVALQKAEDRRGHLTVAHKENALPHLPWSTLVAEVAQAFPGVQVEPMLVDNLAMQLVRHPQRFDVILAGNLFGDILSDLGGAIAGSIGLLGSASFNDQGLGLYEPVHGTAPDIAGQGIANPLGMINSIGLMLQQWGEASAATALVQVQQDLLTAGYRTLDLDPQGDEIVVKTQALTALFCEQLRARGNQRSERG